MPAVPETYVCDLPGCGVVFQKDNGYSVWPNLMTTGQAGVAAFTYPDFQPFYCCASHAFEDAANGLVAMHSLLTERSTEAGKTVQEDPPTSL